MDITDQTEDLASQSNDGKPDRLAQKSFAGGIQRKDQSERLLARANKRAVLKARKAASRAAGINTPTQPKPLTPASDIFEAYLAQAPSPISLEHLRDHCATNAAEYRSICTDFPNPPENQSHLQAKRIFCYFEVLLNSKDDWTEDQFKKAIKRVNHWENKGFTDYRPDWKNADGGNHSKVSKEQKASHEERQARKDAVRRKRRDEREMMKLLHKFGVKEDTKSGSS